METRIAADWASLEALSTDWWDLYTRVPDATPFQSPEWLLPWWRFLGEGEIRMMVLYRENKMIAAAPFYLAGGGRRSLRLMGEGVSDYLDVLIDPAYRREAINALLEQLGSSSAEWDECDFQQLRKGSPLLELPAGPIGSEEVDRNVPCPMLQLPDRPDALRLAASRSMLENLDYCFRKAKRQWAIEFVATDPANVDEVIERLIRLHGARWEARGGEGVLANESVQRFHRAAAVGLARCGLLRAYLLRFDGSSVGVFYGFEDRGRTYFYLSGYDPEYAAYSPGGLVIRHAIEVAIERRCRTFDFLRGCEPYKYRWGARDVSTFRRRLYRDRSTSRPES